MPANSAHLDDRGVLRVAGADAATFLQGLLTNDVEKLSAGEARFAALLSPQGKILFDFFVLRAGAPTGEEFWLDCAADQVDELIRRLGFYKLRAKLAIVDERAAYGVVAFWDGAPPAAPGMRGFIDPRHAALGFRAIVPADGVAAFFGGRSAYEAHRIGLGVPSGGADFTYGEAFPADVNMDLLHGVDFEKGCYVGQEVVARMRHRAAIRKRILRVALSLPAPSAGAPIVAGARGVGIMGSSAGAKGLAMFRLDRLAEAQAAGERLLVDGDALVSVVTDAQAP